MLETPLTKVGRRFIAEELRLMSEKMNQLAQSGHDQ